VYCVKRCEAITLKRMTVQRRIADISKHPETQLTEIFNKCVYFALTVDQSTDITSTAQMCTTSEKLVDLHSMQGQAKGPDFIQELLCSFLKHNSEISKLVDTVLDGAPCSTNGMVPPLYKHMNELGIQNELIQYHYIIHQQCLTGKALAFLNKL